MERKCDKTADVIEIGPLSNGTSSESHPNDAETNITGQSHAMSDIRRALSQCCASGALNLLVMTFGTASGFTTVIVAVLDEIRKKDENFISMSQLTWMSSLNYIALLIGTIFSGLISQWIGRRNALILSTLPYVASWILLYMCEEGQLWPIFLGVLLLGCCGGIIETPFQVYVAEISEPRLRGALSCSTGVTYLIGIFLEILVGKYLDWRTLALVSISLPVISLISLSLVPESPYWLASKGRYEESLKALAWLRGWSPVSQLPQDEFRAILASTSKKTDAPLTVKRYFDQSAMRPFALVSFMFLACCFNGSTTILPWAIPLFKEMHSPLDEHDTAIVLTAIQFIAMIVLTIMVPHTGKRRLTLASLGLGGVAFLVVALYGFYAPESARTNWVSTIGVLIAIASIFIGVKHIPWILVGEVFPDDIRSIMAGVAGCSGTIYAIVAIKSFVYTKQMFTLPGTFLFYACVNFVAFVVLYYTLLETEGKSLAEIEQYFSSRKVDKNQSDAETSTRDP